MVEEEKIRINDFSRDYRGEMKIKKTPTPKQFLITFYHFVTHVLAFAIIGPWVYMQLYGLESGQTYNTIVSMIAGFYFAKALIFR